MKFFLTACFLISATFLQAQHVWNNKKCAVALTYDDGLNVHLDHVAPALDSLGFKGTFYAPGNSPVITRRMEECRALAANGHELGNHTLFHPCAGKSRGREWVHPDYDLDFYTVNQIVNEIKMANTLLDAVDGKQKRTYAYTCGDFSIGDESFVDSIKSEFVAARGVSRKIERIDSVDLFDIGAVMINGQSGEELIGMVREAREKNGLLVFLFHGVGGEHDINVSLEAHNKLLDFLKENENDIWIAPVVEIGEFIKTYRRR